MRIADVQVEDGEQKGRLGQTFPYPAEQIIAAATKMAQYHRARQAFWVDEAERLEGELKGSVEFRVREQTGGRRTEAILDPERDRALSEAQAKRDGHRASARTFEAYAGAFGRFPAIREFNLTIADVDYFALHREPGADE